MEIIRAALYIRVSTEEQVRDGYSLDAQKAHLIDEADRTSERIKFVFDRKVVESQVIGGALPMGYRRENGRLVINEKEAEIVRRVFELYIYRLEVDVRPLLNSRVCHLVSPLK